MESAFNSIESLLVEGEELIKTSAGRAENGAANFSNLCERVNAIGTALSQIKSEVSEFNKEKEEIYGIIEKLENLDAKEIEKLANILK